MPNTIPDMMVLRRSALDDMVRTPAPGSSQPFAGIRLNLADFDVTDDPTRVPADLVGATVRRLGRDRDAEGAGAALVTGLATRFDLPAARAFHETLFRSVWHVFRLHAQEIAPRGTDRIKVGVTSDGVIPVELYGSNWSFKKLHADRDALLFSHLYGPAAGFIGGSLLLVDVRAYMRTHQLRFDDVFEWSQEPTPGSKPVLRNEHEERALAECGIDIGPVDLDSVLLINNCPGSGILHGVTPVRMTDPDRFVREYQRCSVRQDRN